MNQADLQRVVEWLNHAERVVLITGAGISAEAGLPTYRGVSGLYEQANTPEGMPIEVALSGPMFHARPELTWRYLTQVEEACRGAEPSRAHRLVARMQARLPQSLLLTQNVDGLHQAAGSDTVAIHGDVHTLRCTRCTWRQRVSDYAHLAAVPTCPRCDQLIRPDVVLFGELLGEAPLRRLQSFLEAGVDLVFSIGTTSVFPYIAAPVHLARSNGGHAVEINPGESEVSRDVDVRLRLGATAALEAIWQAWTGEPP